VEGTKVAVAEAENGQKMIEVRVRCWTDDIAPEKGKIVPKHAWGGGVVRMAPNKAHGIRSDDPVPFNSLMELCAVIEKVLIRNGITLHLSDRMDRYMDSQPQR
jgi:hypothetical protein